MGDHEGDHSDILSDVPEIDIESAESYSDVNEGEIPDWLVAINEKFEGSSVTPYQPPRFEDGVPKRAVIDRLEDELGIEIRVVGVNAMEEEDWTIRVDGESVGRIGRRRSSDGFTVFEMTSTEFVEVILSRV